jgi:AcrR family transcriptional regulator
MSDPASPPTRERILNAAEALFAERGFAGTSMRDVAARVGINPASLYNHFHGKDALYEAVLERGIAPLLQELARVAATPSAEARPDLGDAVIDALMRQLAGTPHLPRLVQHEAVRGGAHLARLARRFIRPLFSEGLAALKRSPESGRFEPDELPLLIAAYMHIVFGHFAMAPLLAEVLDHDPLAPDVLALQTGLLRKLSRLLLGSAEPGGSSR